MQPRYTEETERIWYAKHLAGVPTSTLMKEYGAAWMTIERAIKKQHDLVQECRPPAKLVTIQQLVGFLQARRLRAGFSRSTRMAYLDGEPIEDRKLLEFCNRLLWRHPTEPYFQLPEPKAS